MRQSTLLSQLSFRLCACIYKDGKGTESFAKSGKDKRSMRQADVLLKK